MAMDISNDQRSLLIRRDDSIAADEIRLDRQAAQILAAYIGSVLALGVGARPPEEVGDEEGTVLVALDDPAPLVRVTQGRRQLDIHAPSWAALRCEIDLMVPRLTHSSPEIAERQT